MFRRLWLIGAVSLLALSAPGPLRPAEADIWREQTKIAPDNLTDYTGFGASVAMDGEMILVGPFSGPYVHMYQGAAETWEEVAKLPSPFATSPYAMFGLTVALDDGTGLVGNLNFAPPDQGGAVGANIYVPTSWGMGAVPLTLPSQSYGDYLFLGNLALQGNLAVVGSPGDNESGNLSGAVYLFENTGGDVVRTRLAASVGGPDGGFGHALALEGDRLVIGAPGDDCNTGAVYVFDKGVSGWTQQAKLTAGVEDGGFGRAVSVCDDVIVVGAPDEDERSGAAYVYEKTGATWAQVNRLVPRYGGYMNYFGGSVDVDGNHIFVGSVTDNEAAHFAGAAYVFRDTGTTWTEVAKLTASDPTVMGYFGYDVALEGTQAIIGRFAQSAGGGAAYIFTLEPDDPDMNADGKVDGGDLAIWQQHYDPTGDNSHWWNTGDCNGDGKVDGGDLALWQQGYDPLGTPDPGDANDDGKVDGGDLALWQQNYDPLGAGQNTWGMGDWNGDGKIDGGDLALWQQNYDPLGTGGLDGTQHVPEPTTLGLIALGGALALLKQRR